MSEITEKLKQLRAVQPTESWIIEQRTEVLSKAPISMLENNSYSNSFLGINFESFFASKLAISVVAFIFVISGGFVTVFASSGSLPGEPLYSVKMATEGVELAVTSEDNKAEVEIRQVGKRVEELAKISQNHSDVNQKAKVEKLLEEIDLKSSSVNFHLAKLNKDGEKKKAVAVAKIVNNQSEKYAEVIAMTSNDLPESIKNEVSEKAERALISNQKTKFSSLMVMIEGKDEAGDDIVTNEEIKEKIQKEIDIEIEKTEVENVEASIEEAESAETLVEEAESVETPDKKCEIPTENIIDEEEIDLESDCSESATVTSNTKNNLLSSAKESLSHNNLLEAANSIIAVKEFDENNAEEALIGSEEETVTGENVDKEGEVKGENYKQEIIITEKELISVEEEEAEPEPNTEEAL